MIGAFRSALMVHGILSVSIVETRYKCVSLAILTVAPIGCYVLLGVGSQASGIAIPLSLLIYLKLLKIQAIASALGLGIC